ncbi:carbonic anhydrase [Actinomadura opuntiae]|uniref:carbonic anhydrase n=1 Tax=Actinomadura sp. OS1-43 TaxID=604315 RepID=UPI0033422657
MVGGIEYGVEVLGCPLVVVLGHDACGAGGGDGAGRLYPGRRRAGDVQRARGARRGQGGDRGDPGRAHQDPLLDRSRVLAERANAGGPRSWAVLPPGRR